MRCLGVSTSQLPNLRVVTSISCYLFSENRDKDGATEIRKGKEPWVDELCKPQLFITASSKAVVSIAAHKVPHRDRENQKLAVHIHSKFRFHDLSWALTVPRQCFNISLFPFPTISSSFSKSFSSSPILSFGLLPPIFSAEHLASYFTKKKLDTYQDLSYLLLISNKSDVFFFLHCPGLPWRGGHCGCQGKPQYNHK